MNVVSAISPENIGAELYAQGCRQGAALPDVATILLFWEQPDIKGSSGDLVRAELELDGYVFVVISQGCDIYAKLAAEPNVEVIAASWTEDIVQIATAAKRNSARLFLIKKDGAKALIADARKRALIQKRALVSRKYENIFENDQTKSKFAEWLAGRYDRPALPNEIVDAIQKPLVKELGVLQKKNTNKALIALIDRIEELRISYDLSTKPWKVDFTAMVAEGDDLGVEGEAEILGWLDEILVRDGGSISEIRLIVRDYTSISVADYTKTQRLQLDQFSPEDED